jgi:hypothetical protein
MLSSDFIFDSNNKNNIKKNSQKKAEKKKSDRVNEWETLRYVNKAKETFGFFLKC